MGKLPVGRHHLHRGPYLGAPLTSCPSLSPCAYCDEYHDSCSSHTSAQPAADPDRDRHGHARTNLWDGHTRWADGYPPYYTDGHAYHADGYSRADVYDFAADGYSTADGYASSAHSHT
jgi:hypothetical protein